VCDEAKDVLSDSLLAHLKRLEANAVKMGQLIDNLLQYSRIGRVNMTSRDVDLSAIATRIADELQVSREGTVDVQPGIVVQGDPQMLEMVLVNLFENAWKYVLPGDAPKVEMGITDQGAIFVRDHGIGFDMQYAEKVWEPFERLHNDSEYPGTGIGLANSKRIINRHGGRMWTESTPGVGTTMYFNLASTLPPAEEKAAPSRRAKARAR
jgi:light-regulated signal transduction histidine kinase (bacteriophytochrome)